MREVYRTMRRMFLLDRFEMIDETAGEAGGTLMVHEDISLGQSRVALLPTGQAGLGGQLVVGLTVHVLRPNLDVSRVDPRARRFGGVESEGNSSNLWKSAVQFGPLGHSVLQSLVNLRSFDVDQNQGVNHR